MHQIRPAASLLPVLSLPLRTTHHLPPALLFLLRFLDFILFLPFFFLFLFPSAGGEENHGSVLGLAARRSANLLLEKKGGGGSALQDIAVQGGGILRGRDIRVVVGGAR